MSRVLRPTRSISAFVLSVAAGSAHGQVLYADDFNEDSSSRYNVISSGDTDARFAFDYGTLGIPSAPGAASTTGLYLQAHATQTTQSHALTVALNQVLQNPSPRGYRVDLDVWQNAFGPFNGMNEPITFSGRTTFFTAGVGHDGTSNNFAGNAGVAGGTPETGAGVWFAAAGDGYAARDYRAYRNGQEALASADSRTYAAHYQGSEHSYYTRRFGSVDVRLVNDGALTAAQGSRQSGSTGAGSQLFAWHHWSIEVMPDRVRWAIDGSQIAVFRKDWQGTFDATPRVALGQLDMFPSAADVPELTFSIADNLVVSARQTLATLSSAPTVRAADGHRYLLLAQSDWTTAEERARELGGHLVTIDSQAENDFIYSAFGNFGGTGRNLWLGLTDEANAAFVWTDGSASSYRNWQSGQPDNLDVAEDYALMWGAGVPAPWQPGRWNDVPDLMSAGGGLLSGLPMHGVVEIAPLAGDATLDDRVDFSDLLALARSYGHESGETWLTGDFTGNGGVNFDDLLLLARNYGASRVDAGLLRDSQFESDWALARSIVPEPSLGLLAIGLIAAPRTRGGHRRRPV